MSDLKNNFGFIVIDSVWCLHVRGCECLRQHGANLLFLSKLTWQFGAGNEDFYLSMIWDTEATPSGSFSKEIFIYGAWTVFLAGSICTIL